MKRPPRIARSIRYALLCSLALWILLQGMIWLAIEYWPNFSEALAKNSATIKMLGKLGPVRDMIDQVEERGVYAYLVGQQFFKSCNTLGVAAAVFFSVSAVAGEAHRGTLELMLARPLSRTRILLERYFIGAVALLVPVILSSVSIPLLCEGIPPLYDGIGESQSYRLYALGAVHQCAILLAVYGISFLLSALSSQPIKIALIQLFFYTAHFAVYLIKNANHWSLFKLGDIERYLDIEVSGGLDWTICAPLLAVAAGTLLLSIIAFRRRVP